MPRRHVKIAFEIELWQLALIILLLCLIAILTARGLGLF